MHADMVMTSTSWTWQILHSKALAEEKPSGYLLGIEHSWWILLCKASYANTTCQIPWCIQNVGQLKRTAMQVGGQLNIFLIYQRMVKGSAGGGWPAETYKKTTVCTCWLACLDAVINTPNVRAKMFRLRCLKGGLASTCTLFNNVRLEGLKCL